MSKLSTVPLISASCRESAASTLCSLSTTHVHHLPSLIGELSSLLSKVEMSAAYPAFIIALKMLLLQVQKSKMSDKTLDYKLIMDQAVNILISATDVPYSTILSAFELLNILIKAPSAKILLQKQKNDFEFIPLTGEVMKNGDDVEEGTIAKDLCRSVCEKYLFSNPDSSSDLFLPDTGNSRVSIKTLVVSISAFCIGMDSSIISEKIYNSKIIHVSSLSQHEDPGLKGAVANFVAQVILTSPTDVEPFVNTLIELLLDESHQVVLKAVQGVKYCLHHVIRKMLINLL